jgi:glycosyltransferase involved in cell wall biosynthesis
LNVEGLKTIKFWSTLFGTKPDIIHYIPGPTLKGLVFVKLIQLLTRSKSVISATQPTIPKNQLFKLISTMLKPDIVLVQSEKSEALFKDIKYTTRFLPNGVNTDRFIPVMPNRKNELRKKYGFSEEDFIVLHIGPIKSGRNQRSLLHLHDVKVLLIVSITNPTEQAAYDELSKTKAIIWKRYFPNIEEIYAICDVYIWPVFKELHGIEMPLSVLEAMSCNLPVICSRYGALSRLFHEGDGLIFIDRETEIEESILRIKNKKININTRDKVKSLSWSNIANNISEVYEGLYQ